MIQQPVKGVHLFKIRAFRFYRDALSSYRGKKSVYAALAPIRYRYRQDFRVGIIV